MVTITLPNGDKRNYPGPVTGEEIATDIGARLAADAVAVQVDGQLWDLTRPIEKNATIGIITRQREEGLDILRHDAAHVLAQAVKELYPETLVTIGPSIENGFYYDFHREVSFTPEDIERMEQRMHEIVDRKEPFIRQVWGKEKALEYYRSKGENFKVELIESLPEGEEITFYTQGSFTDLCRGPHLPHTGKLGHGFKLTKLAGSYWRGDSRNPTLQRIYGTAWANEKDLAAYLTRLEEAEKRDHRKLGKEMELFHLQEEAVGSVFWHPKGWNLYETLRQYIRRRLSTAGYGEVNTPQLVDRALWEASGHWEKFKENMFVTHTEDDKFLALKPMNCPCHIQIFKQGIKSYRDLPLRLSEFGVCHRYEPSGALHGLMRVRAFTQDDAHIFCTPSQITSETQSFCELLLGVYKDLGFTEVRVKFSDRPEKRAGADAVWDQAEEALLEAVKATGLAYTLNPGEGAFYGPKLEFVLRDAIGREWQCGTLQVDFVLPERLDATYVGEEGDRHRPVMLHRAILGSFERFIGVLIEHYGGKFPLWLAPVQVVVATITQEGDAYAQEVYQALKKAGLRAHVDLRNEKINYKIRELSLSKVPVILVVGKKEAQSQSVSVRRLGGEAQEVVALSQIVDKLREEAQEP
jgi:threonyl-tRNA synthetase